MKSRSLLGVIVLGMALVTATLARQDTSGPARSNADPSSDKSQARAEAAASLSSQVAQLRAEVELLDLEHQVTRTYLMEAMKEQ